MKKGGLVTKIDSGHLFPTDGYQHREVGFMSGLEKEMQLNEDKLLFLDEIDRKRNHIICKTYQYLENT